jgi:HEPN domain-containing protein
MIERENKLKVIREWVEKAENDFANAVNTLKMGEKCPTDTVCFHAQQCVEKYLKAILVWNGIEFPKTHNISELAALIPVVARPLLNDEEKDRLTEYATGMRYPGDYEAIPLSEARKAVGIARRTRKTARLIFPKEVLLWRRR